MFLSHGTQDLYPHFLKSVHGFPLRTVSNIAILYNVGAVIGAIIFGHLSEKIGRRRSMISALALSFLMIPAWAFGGSLLTLAFGAFLMQIGVQGAWGIIPAHLNELSPDSVRGLMPGFAYQLGILFAAPVNNIEYGLRNRLGYSWALASFEALNIVLLAITIALGREQKGKSFLTDHSQA
jgi:MFS transporter, SHS family, lactate transporter